MWSSSGKTWVVKERTTYRIIELLQRTFEALTKALRVVLIKLPAGENDVLHALMASGGLPGVNAKNEIKILRSSKADQKKRDEFIQQFYQNIMHNPNPCLCPPPLPDDPAILKIPMRMPPA